MTGSVTITELTPGEVDADQPVATLIRPGTYQVEQVDCGDAWLVVDDFEYAVIIPMTALGIETCGACDGRGELIYPFEDGCYETADCFCDGRGWLTTDEADQLAAELERQNEALHDASYLTDAEIEAMSLDGDGQDWETVAVDSIRAEAEKAGQPITRTEAYERLSADNGKDYQ